MLEGRDGEDKKTEARNIGADESEDSPLQKSSGVDAALALPYVQGKKGRRYRRLADWRFMSGAGPGG